MRSIGFASSVELVGTKRVGKERTERVLRVCIIGKASYGELG